MFDVGFSEMVVIAVVALIVIGPERLPKLARTMGHLIGRMNRYVADVKADINREMEVEELRKFKEQFQDAAQSVEHTIHEGLSSAQAGLDRLEESSATAVPKPSPGDETGGTALTQTPPTVPPPAASGTPVSPTQNVGTA